MSRRWWKPQRAEELSDFPAPGLQRTSERMGIILGRDDGGELWSQAVIPHVTDYTYEEGNKLFAVSTEAD